MLSHSQNVVLSSNLELGALNKPKRCGSVSKCLYLVAVRVIRTSQRVTVLSDDIVTLGSDMLRADGPLSRGYICLRQRQTLMFRVLFRQNVALPITCQESSSSYNFNPDFPDITAIDSCTIATSINNVKQSSPWRPE